MNEREAHELIRRMLSQCTTLSLATAAGRQVHAANLFYVSDAALNLYFLSAASTMHARHIEANREVAVTVAPDCRSWNDIRGIQLAGEARLIQGADRTRAFDLYLEKFDEISRMLSAPTRADERRILDSLADSGCYRIAPRRVRLIDNSRGFGWKVELRLPLGEAG